MAPTGPAAGSSRVVRGGNWYNNACYCRSAYRGVREPAGHNQLYGFRVVAEIASATGGVSSRAPGGRVAVRQGYALQFDGKRDQVSVPGMDPQNLKALTIEARLTPTATDIPHSEYPLNCICTGCGIRKVSALGHTQHANQWQFDASTPWAKSTDTYCWSSEPAQAGRQDHVAGVWDGKQMRLYVNGQIQADRKPLDRVGLGKPGCSLGSAFCGQITEVRISSVARYDQNFVPADRFEPDAQTLLLYHFDEGQGEVLHDASGHGHNSKIAGAKWVKIEETEDMQARTARPATHSAMDDAFIKAVAALPAEQQVARVVAKLKELNPGYDGKEMHKIEEGQVTELKLDQAAIADLGPVAALGKLHVLTCSYSRVADLSPLCGLPLVCLGLRGTRVTDLSAIQGMPLKELQLQEAPVSDLLPLRGMRLTGLYCGNDNITDLSPLKGMPLTFLHVGSRRVSDLTPLKGMPLTELFVEYTSLRDLSLLQGMPLKMLRCRFTPECDLSPLRSIKTLEQINRIPVAEFWKQVDAGKVPQPAK
jgi:hypothetical protein